MLFGFAFNGGGLFRRGIVPAVDGFERKFAGGVFLQLLDFQLGLGQLGLADFGQARALLETGQQRFQRQLVRLHRFHDGLQFLQRLFKR